MRGLAAITMFPLVLATGSMEAAAQNTLAPIGQPAPAGVPAPTAKPPPPPPPTGSAGNEVQEIIVPGRRLSDFQRDYEFHLEEYRRLKKIFDPDKPPPSRGSTLLNGEGSASSHEQNRVSRPWEE